MACLVGIFASGRETVTGGWRKLHNEKLHNLYCSPNNITVINSRRNGWSGHIARIGVNRNALIRELERKIPRGEPTPRWEVNVTEMGWEAVDWIQLA
jgi:hypothetical protein